MGSIRYLEPDTVVTFKLENALPIFSERYISPEAGTVVLKGLLNQKAHIETLDGEKFRMLAAKKDKRYPNKILYPIVHLPDKEQVFHIASPLHIASAPGGRSQLRYTVVLDDERYVFRRMARKRREFELWDGPELNRIVKREASAKLVADLTVLLPVPDLLILLFPWMDNQNMVHSQS